MAEQEGAGKAAQGRNILGTPQKKQPKVHPGEISLDLQGCAANCCRQSTGAFPPPAIVTARGDISRRNLC